jgi:aspartate aminotransferase
MRLSREVGRIKNTKGLPLEDIEVEKRLRAAIKNKSLELGIDQDFAFHLLNLLIAQSVDVQRDTFSKSDVSPTGINQQARLLEESGRNIIHLETGEPDFPTPKPIMDALKTAVNEGRTGYNDATGVQPLRAAVAEHLNRKIGTDLTSDEILITHGARFGLYLALSTTLNPGGGALLFEPSYPAYKKIVDLFDGRSITVRTALEDGWTPDVDVAKDVIDERPDVIILNYPSNPTGKVLNTDIFQGVVERAARNNVPVISDEVYRDYSFKQCPSILEYSDCRSIMLSSFSKSYSMTGFRIGYAVASKDDIERMSRIQGLALTCIPEFIQHAAIKALECGADLTANIEKMRNRIEYAANLLEDLPATFYQPDGGFYLFPRINRSGFDAEIYAASLLENHGVAVTPGTAFGNYRNFLRISLCQPEARLKEAFRIIGETLK